MNITPLIGKNLSVMGFIFSLLITQFFSPLTTDGSFRQSRPNLTSLLVQPISASLVKMLISLPKLIMDKDVCSPLELQHNGKATCALAHLLIMPLLNLSLDNPSGDPLELSHNNDMYRSLELIHNDAQSSLELP